MRNRVWKVLCFALFVAMVPLVAVQPGGADDPVGFLPSGKSFVSQQYEDFLSRPADASGLNHWSTLIDNGLDPSAMVEALALSSEFEGTIAPVVRLYYAHFLRPPDYDGMTYWAQVARQGWTIQKISEEFVLSQEFRNRYGTLTNRQYVDQLYVNVLGRQGDAGGQAYWLGQLSSGVTRGEAMVAFSDSTEYRKITGSRVLATMLYVGMLRRAPDAAGLAYWTSVIDSGVPYRNVIAGFLGAKEYGRRMAATYDEYQPLTGVPTKDRGSHAALAIKIDNVAAARPPKNLDRADIVYEEMVEGNLTRFIAVFHSDLPDVVGPVRSIRTTDIDVLAQLNRPLLSASGANSGVLAAVANADVVNVNALAAGGAYFRSSSRSAPHNMYVRPADLYRAANGSGRQAPHLFRYRSPGVAPINSSSVGGVILKFGATDVQFGWSPAERGWLRSQDGRPHVTAEGKRLAPENVVILEVGYGTSQVDAKSPEAHTIGSGPAYVLTDGKLVSGTWSRSSARQPIKIKDGKGTEIRLTRGQTFVELAPPGSVDLY